jgi:flagellar protein FlaG
MAIEMIKGTPLEYKIVPNQNKNLKEAGIDITKIEKNVLENKAYLTSAIEQLKDAGDIFKRRLDFKIDEETNRIMIKVIDTKTNKVVKEIPPEQLIRLAAKIQEMLGILVDEER